jgi:hypothetical protein
VPFRAPYRNIADSICPNRSQRNARLVFAGRFCARGVLQ